jgi:hypothetical protein
MIKIAIGTPINAPGMPHKKLQKKTANTTASGETVRAAPARLFL